MLEIVSSCWRYSKCLTYHCSGYVIHPPDVPVVVTVWTCPEDAATLEVMRYFRGFEVPNVKWNFRILSRRRLMRRSISRNLASMFTRADWVIFTDVDYVYQGGAINEIWAELHGCDPWKDLCYTRNVRGNAHETIGDEMLQRVTDLGLYEFRYEDTVPHPISRPIGGSQIVGGDYARRYGYLHGHPKYSSPCPTWKRTTCDVNFRSEAKRNCGIKSRPLRTDKVLRVRHSRKGRNGLCLN